MKALITYSSQTGNTLKLAEKIFDTLEGEKELCSIDKAPLTDEYDLVAIGFWLQAGKPDPKSIEYLSKCNKNSRLFLFLSHGAAKGSDHVKNAVNYAVDLTNGAKIAGIFTCQGEVNPKVLEKIKQKEKPPVWISDADDAVGHPNEKDFEELAQMINNL
ncbi:MAG: flavodoxin family protein [Desulfobacteraceae bacterium]|nr:flavodoxin family protein [Desulfobacteraceae bacterium]